MNAFWVVSTRVMCGDDYAVISWREVIVERSAVRRQEINTPLPSNVVIGAWCLLVSRAGAFSCDAQANGAS